ncbi:MAG: 30S ribosomal protein S15 [Spirochaetes bacterium GWF1_51_8]|nr:MAG: 30S ribosomal protein S15 [Spirochaetes bacterium GWF1_51_8]
MPITSSDKKTLVDKYATHEGDTGSPEVQIALITNRINNLTRHFKSFKNDNNSKRGLMKLVGQRKRLLRYLHKIDVERYKTLIESLEIRGSF